MSWPHPAAQTLVAAMVTLLHLRNSSSFRALSILVAGCSQISKVPEGFWLSLFQPWEFGIPVKCGLRKWDISCKNVITAKKGKIICPSSQRYPNPFSILPTIYATSSRPCHHFFLVFFMWECSFAAQTQCLCWAICSQWGISTNVYITEEKQWQHASVAYALLWGFCEVIWGDFFFGKASLDSC